MKRFKDQFRDNILVIMTVFIMLIIVLTIKTFDYMITNQQDDDIQQLSGFIMNSIENSVSAEDLIQNYLVEILENVTYQVEEDLSGVELSTIDVNFLEEIKSRYKLSEVALFRKLEDDIIIETSTAEHEIGLSTKDWGFWYDAFSQLLDDKEVTVGKGISKGRFWAGPRSLAYGQDGYYIFTYYKLENQPYLLNLYVDDMNAFGLVKKNDPNALLKNILDESEFIHEIAVINVEAWNDRFTEEKRAHLQDFTVEYGAYSAFTAHDTYYLNKINSMGLNSSIKKSVTIEGKEYTKIYKKLRNDQAIIFLIDDSDKEYLKRRMIWIILGGLLLICITGFFMVFSYTKSYSELLKLERKRLKIANEYRHTVQILPSIILRLVKNRDNIIVKHCEGKALSELGIDASSAHDKLLEEVLPKDYYKLAVEGISQACKNREYIFEHSFNKKVYENKVQLIADISDEHIQEIIIFANDITRIRESEDKAKYLAYHDNLTDLPNRLCLKERVEALIKEMDRHFIMCFIDLDGFKEINDTAGHDVGDKLLKAMADRISELADNDDFAARIGGDEFAFIFMDIDSDNQIKEKVDNLSKIIAAPFTIDGQSYSLTSSIGVSRFPKDALSYNELIKKSDLAMYEIKDNGKDGFKIFTSEEMV